MVKIGGTHADVLPGASATRGQMDRPFCFYYLLTPAYRRMLLCQHHPNGPEMDINSSSGRTLPENDFFIYSPMCPRAKDIRPE